ncbi:MAG: Asp-tRNA(Asn)/Glu-tRNA(Gln) amidotransferase subunit GatC [Persicimonas sp.]
MTISRDEVRRIARLARIEVSDDEIDQYRDDLGSILAYVDKLDELDLEGVEPTVHAVDVAPHLRDDEARERLTHAQVLDNAPDAESGHFRVPRAVEEG